MNKNSTYSKERIASLIEKKEKRIKDLESEIQRSANFSKEHGIPFDSHNSEVEIKKIKNELISLYRRASDCGFTANPALSTI